MTKKDYILLASILREYRKLVFAGDGLVNEKNRFESLLFAFIGELKNENPKFDAAKFRAFIEKEPKPEDGGCIYNHDHKAEPEKCEHHN